MQIIKRDGTIENVKFDKVSTRLQYLSDGLAVDHVFVAQQVIARMTSGIKTSVLDEFAAKIASDLILTHPDYTQFAARIACSNYRKNIPHTFTETIKAVNERILPEYAQFIENNAETLDRSVCYSRNELFAYTAQMMLFAKYLLRVKKTETDTPLALRAGETFEKAYDGAAMIVRGGIGFRCTTRDKYEVVDNAQHMYLRVAVNARFPCLPEVLDVYTNMSKQLYTHATPTLFNACTVSAQLLSCFLMGTRDCITGIMKNASDASIISKMSGGLGIHMHNVRGAGAYIRGTGGITNGLIKQLDIYAAIAETWNQGGGKRPGAISIYLEPTHSDILEFLRRFLPHEIDSLRGKLFPAMWMPDLFFKKFLAGEQWCLFNDDTAPGLCDVYDGMEVCEKCDYCYNPSYSRVYRGVFVGYEGRPAAVIGEQETCEHKWKRVDAYTHMYNRYAREGRAVNVVPTVQIMDAIVKCLQLSGVPYILAKDTCNRLSNQSNLGTIKSSNLCTEIIEWSGTTSDYLTGPPKQSYACCALASINLPKFFTRGDFPRDREPERKYYTVIPGGYFDHGALRKVVHEITRNLDNILDVNKYPVVECAENSRRYRPIAVGVQGLANVFLGARVSFDSDDAAQLDLEIAETIYFAFLEESSKLAIERGAHVAWETSPLARGRFHFELWAEERASRGHPDVDLVTSRWSWEPLRETVMKTGVRNSLGVAYMPTVSTSQLLGNNESFEPFADIAYSKKTNTGSYFVVNESFQRHMIELGLWTEKLKMDILLAGGDITKVAGIPAGVQDIYKSVWDIKQRAIISRAAHRGRFVDQSQSMNLHLQNGSRQVIISAIIDGWRQGLKTISYYMRMRTVDTMKNVVRSSIPATQTDGVCTMSEGCVSCSS